MKKLGTFVLVFGMAGALWAGQVAQPGVSKQQQQKQNPNAAERAGEAAQEKASGIKDTVDIVNGPAVQNLTANSAWLTWETNKTAASRVRYGTDQANPSQHAYVAGGSTQHRVELKNLKPHTTYYYEIENRTGSDRFKGSFQTP